MKKNTKKPVKSAYAAAGVDIDEMDRGLKSIKKAVSGTRTPGVLSEIGSFGGLFRSPGRGQVLVASTLRDGETRSLRDRDYWVIRADGVESRRIDDPDELAAILLNDFGLRVDHAECVRLLDGRTRRD